MTESVNPDVRRDDNFVAKVIGQVGRTRYFGWLKGIQKQIEIFVVAGVDSPELPMTNRLSRPLQALCTAQTLQTPWPLSQRAARRGQGRKASTP